MSETGLRQNTQFVSHICCYYDYSLFAAIRQVWRLVHLANDSQKALLCTEYTALAHIIISNSEQRAETATSTPRVH